ncbi:hypothetical protein WJX74_005209 [Apatococcus lobatus]|uniref:Nuclear/nucleolar GTPase 2 n=1 Tax=Apatococcus lobatus TaxID=904363 RepID=A0AAW1RUJ7_9CHLO
MGKARTKSEDKRKPKHGLDVNRPSKGDKGSRDAATVRRLNMYKKRATRDSKGKIIHQDFQSKDLPNSRIQPDRRWFGNTRVIGQKQLETFREEMSSKVGNAYTVLLREKKLPMSLLEDPEKKPGKASRVHLLQTQPFQSTFGQKQNRKRPRLAADSYSQLRQSAEAGTDKYDEGGSLTPLASLEDPEPTLLREQIFQKGQSKRIWGELYKVVDSSDVVVQVLDARDPLGTRCKHLEHHLKKNARHKHLLLLLNKCDLVPAWVTKRWLGHLSSQYPTLAFHASITNPFGKGSLLGLLRQLARLRSDKKYISVGFVGYPNVGKSSVINTLRTKKVCNVAPVPGETKVWQYITLMKKIFLIDCPGVVYNKTEDTDTDAVLKGVVRVENLEEPAEHVQSVLDRIKPEYIRRAYKIKEWTGAEDFLDQLARGTGKLGKGGEPDLATAAKMLLYDWQRGKLPFFTLPPDYEHRPKPDPAAAASPAAADAIPADGIEPAEAGAAAVEEVDEEASSSSDDSESIDDMEAVDDLRGDEAAARSEKDPKEAAMEAMMTAAATAAAEEQTRGNIPMQQDFFTAIDAGEAGSEDDAPNPEEE